MCLCAEYFLFAAVPVVQGSRPAAGRGPVIEYIYSGPGDAYTPKSFMPYNWYTTSLAELGFIVVQLDAMGTSYRGKKFEEVCYKNLKDA